MTILTQMREAADLLPVDDPVRKALIWADMELGDRSDRIFELEEDETSLYKEIDVLRLELHRVKALLEHQNIMAAHGVAPYAKTKRKPKVVTA